MVETGRLAGPVAPKPQAFGAPRQSRGAPRSTAKLPAGLADDSRGQRRVELDDIAQESEVAGQRSRQAALEHGQREIEHQRADDPETDGAAEGGNRGWARGRRVH